jgi:hypothetical protein
MLPRIFGAESRLLEAVIACAQHRDRGKLGQLELRRVARCVVDLDSLERDRADLWAVDPDALADLRSECRRILELERPAAR